MDIALTHRLGPGDVELRAHDLPWTEGILQQPRGAIDLANEEPLGTRPIRRRWLLLIDLGHERGPRRSGENTALRVRLDLRWTIEPHPHSGDEIRSVADVPHVGAVVGGASLSGGWNAESRPPHGAVRSTATDDVAHHVHHEPRLFARHHFGAGGRRLPEHIAAGVLDAQNRIGLRPHA